MLKTGHRTFGKDQMRRPNEDQRLRKQKEPRARLATDHHRRNYQYKRLYRSVYNAYEVALEQNLNDLRQRLLGGAFEAQHPERIYLPKASGLHRPLALLNLYTQL